MRRIALSLIALVALGTGALGWYVLRPERSLTGAALGRLRLGVTRANLNLLVVTLDTTRADRLGAYGYTGAQTPTIDRLARDGVLFEEAITSAPLTLPAHSTLFTGRFPPAHGVRDNGGFYLESSQLTLAEVLRERHVRTGAFVAAYVLDGKWGLNQGFDTYVDDFDLSRYRAISLGDIQRPANEVIDSALKWLDEARSSRFFAGCICTILIPRMRRPNPTAVASRASRTMRRSRSRTPSWDGSSIISVYMTCSTARRLW